MTSISSFLMRHYEKLKGPKRFCEIPRVGEMLRLGEALRAPRAIEAIQEDARKFKRTILTILKESSKLNK